jgi:hypothetical protein
MFSSYRYTCNVVKLIILHSSIIFLLILFSILQLTNIWNKVLKIWILYHVPVLCTVRQSLIWTSWETGVILNQCEPKLKSTNNIQYGFQIPNFIKINLVILKMNHHMNRHEFCMQENLPFTDVVTGSYILTYMLKEINFELWCDWSVLRLFNDVSTAALFNSINWHGKMSVNSE